MAAGLSLVWSPNPARVAGYRVYYGPTTQTYTNVIDAGMALGIPLPTAPRPFYGALTSYNDMGLESNFSPEMLYPQPVVIGYRLQCSPTLVGGWTNIVSHSVTNAGTDGSLFFRVVLDVHFQ